MHEATVKLVLTQRQYVDRSYLVVCYKSLKDSGLFLNAEKHFIKSKLP